MSSNVQKGAQAERRLQKTLEADGWLVHRAVRTFVKRPGFIGSNTNDVFNAFDLVAVKPEKPVRFIQVTTNSGGPARRKKIKAIMDRFPMDHWRPGWSICTLELHIWHRRDSPSKKRRGTWQVEIWPAIDNNELEPVEE